MEQGQDLGGAATDIFVWLLGRVFARLPGWAGMRHGLKGAGLVLTADSGEGDWPFLPMVITDSGDRDRGGGVHFWHLCCGLKGAAGQGRTRWSVDRPGS